MESIKHQIIRLIEHRADAVSASFRPIGPNPLPVDAIYMVRVANLESFAEMVDAICTDGDMDLRDGLKHVLSDKNRPIVSENFHFLGPVFDYLIEWANN